MKSERRHELQHNALADWLIQTGKSIQPYQNHLLAAVLVAVAITVGYSIWSSDVAAKTTRAWDEVGRILDSGEAPKLTKVVEDYPHTEAAYMAATVLGDYYLGQGCNQLFVNKATGQTELSKAIKYYEPVLAETDVPATIRERATFGLARAKESKGQADELKQAEQLYQDLLTKWPEGAYAAAAKERLEKLKRPETKKMYDWFAKFDPKPAYSAEPGEKPKFEAPSENALEPTESTAPVDATKKNADAGKVLDNAQPKAEKTPAAEADKK